MSETSVRISLEIADAAAQKALAGITNKAEKADQSIQGIAKSSAAMGKSSQSAAVSFSGLANIITDDIGGRGTQSVGALSGVLSGGLLASIGLVTVAATAMTKWLDLTLISERNNQVSNSFEAIAQSAGLTAEVLREGLLESAQGLADDDDILQAANRSIIELGRNADKIPQIMEMARKATALFGGDLIQNFENISGAIASGNTRLLRQYGIVIDTEAAMDKYAKSIGTTSDRLNEAGKKQALANAALEQASLKFKDVDESSTSATQALQRMKVSLGGVVDAIADASANSGFFSTVMNAIGEAAEGAALFLRDKFGSATEQLNARLRNSQTAITEYSDEIKRLQERMTDASPWSKGVLQAAIDSTRVKLSEAKKEFEQIRKQIDEANKAPSGGFVRLAARNPETAPSDIKQEQKKPEKDEFAERLLKEAENEQALATQRQEILATQRELELISDAEFYAQKQLIAQQAFEQENANLLAAREAGKITESEFFTARDQLANRFAASQAKRDADVKKAERELTKFKEQEEKTRAENLRGSLGYISTLMQSNIKELFFIGKAAAMAQGFIDAQAAVLRALSSAPPPFNFALAGAVGAAAAVNLGRIASQQPPAFEDGGIVGGNSFSGDRVMARVNSGEMVLNRQQQARLFKMANSSESSNASNGRIDQALSMMSEILSQPVSIQIDGREIINVTRSQLASGRSFA